MLIGKKQLFIFQEFVQGSDVNQKYDIFIFREGEDKGQIEEERKGKGYLLNPGESVTLERSRRKAGGAGWLPKGEKVVFINEDGALREEDGEREEKKEFAQQQAKLLSENFNLSKEAAWKIIRVAGPGAAYRATQYGEGLIQEKHGRDLLLVVLNQGGPSRTILGLARTFKLLQKLGINPPNYRNSKDFFRILQGARKYIHLVAVAEEEEEEEIVDEGEPHVTPIKEEQEDTDSLSDEIIRKLRERTMNK